MAKLFRTLLSLTAAILLLFSLGCSPKKTVIDNLDVPKLEHADISICFQGKEPEGMEEVLAEFEKRSASELNLNLDFQFFYMVADQYFSQVESLISSGQSCDAFMVPDDRKSTLEGFVERNIAADITDLFSKHAPTIFSKLDDRAKNFARVNNRFYAVPRIFPMPRRLGVTIRDDLLKKYNTASISNYDELEAFLAKIKQGEPDLYPLTTYNTSIGIFAPVYGYVILDYEAGLVYKWDDKEMVLSAWEQTPEYLEAETRLASWYRNGYILPGHIVQSDAIMYKTGKWAAILTDMGDSVYYNIRNIADEDTNNFSYTEFPLYSETKAAQISPLYLSFVIGQQSNNKERVLMLLDWIQASPENYRLFRYGLLERDYILMNENISFPANTQSLDDLFVNWYGGAAIMNSSLEGPYWMGDRSFKFTKYWEEVCRNSEYVPHSGFSPDYNVNYSCFITRRSSYTDTVTRMNQGKYQTKDSEDFIDKMKKAGTDAFIQGIQQQLDQWRKENMK